MTWCCGLWTCSKLLSTLLASIGPAKTHYISSINLEVRLNESFLTALKYMGGPSPQRPQFHTLFWGQWTFFRGLFGTFITFLARRDFFLGDFGLFIHFILVFFKKCPLFHTGIRGLFSSDFWGLGPPPLYNVYILFILYSKLIYWCKKLYSTCNTLTL